MADSAGVAGVVAGGGPSVAGLVDWRAVSRLAVVATPAGPRATSARRRAVVALLRRSALESPAWVGQVTGLRAASQRVAEGTQVLVVDRAGLISSVTGSLRWVLGQVPAPGPAQPGGVGAPTRLALSAQLAGMVGAFSTRAMGQVLPDGLGGQGGRMLLVAPNVMAFQRGLELDRMDLAAWVALHETTHAVQLCAAPWLGEHLVERLRVALGSVAVAARQGAGGFGVRGLAWALEGREAASLRRVLGVRGAGALEELNVTLALLEGHAEAVLDAVTPELMPSVHRLRQVLSHRRAGRGVGPGFGVSGLVSRVLGVAGKESHYVDGAAFARSVLEAVGHEGLNRVWRGPDSLPTSAELVAPQAWVERVGLG